MLDRPAFWAVHLGLALGDGLDAALAALFGVPLGLLRGTYLRLTDDDGQPEFTVAAALAIRYRRQDVRYLLLPPDDEPIVLGVAEGVPDGPGLSWAELTGVAFRQAGPVSRARALLLLAPMLGDAGVPRGPLAQALRTVGVTGDADTVAARIAAAQPTTWRTVDGVRSCDHPGSTRNPDSARALPAQQRASVSALLDPGR
ncbi:hypothetical protein ACTI_63270 [Actinoplanes sp. OR16]|nr:hypothetical protein ACTI_63270 [Actinoplanes sp. OR16]